MNRAGAPAAAYAPARLWGEPERRRVVRLCALLSGDAGAAEDLAQETLLEAWRNAHKLRDPAGADRWLSAIARNVCLRWARRRGRDLARTAPLPDDLPVAAPAGPGGDDDAGELSELLERAVAQLPPPTREAIVGHYVEHLPHRVLSARLGVSTDALSMRLTRGRAALRELLAAEIGGNAGGGEWRATRVWCTGCGNRRLAARIEPPPGVVAFRCPGCNTEPSQLDSEFQLSNPFFADLLGGLVRPTAILARTAAWSSRYFSEGREAGRVSCTRCGAAVALRPYVRAAWQTAKPNRRGLYALCTACGETVSTSAAGIAATHPETQAFLARHSRTHAVPEREVLRDGVPAVVVGRRDALGTAHIDVVLARDTLRILAVHSTG